MFDDDTFSSLFDDSIISSSSTSPIDDLSTNCCGDINPANGLPMIGCIDVAGNPYGTGSSSLWDWFKS
jgi:hypothetical protein